jgi:hypothetical protein
MKRINHILGGILVGLTAFVAVQPMFGQQTGTLVFDLKNYTSDTKLPKKVEKNLQHGGIQWGMLDKTMLISFVNMQFVKADIPYLTRFGEQKTLELAPGRYTLTCIGYEFDSTSSNVDKVLAKSAFFNKEVLTFAVLPGKATTLQISPILEPESKWRGLGKITFFVPDLKVQVLEDGAATGEELVINRRTASSVAWDDYHGPLKF